MKKKFIYLINSKKNLLDSYFFLKTMKHFIFKGNIFKKVKIDKFLNQKVKFLQIGGGKHVIKERNWINGDLYYGDIYLNANKTLPFPNESINGIFAEQFIEHLNQEKAVKFLMECFRVLAPGGIIRLATPDLEKLIKIYLDINPEVSMEAAVDRHINNHKLKTKIYRRSKCQFLNDVFRLWGHKYIYDFESLQYELIGAGFIDVKRQEYGVSGYTQLNNRERHSDFEWMKNGFNLIIEASKPNY